MFEFIKNLLWRKKPPTRDVREEWSKYTDDLGVQRNVSMREFIDNEKKAYDQLYVTIQKLGEKYRFDDVEELVKQAVREYKEQRNESSTGS